MIRNQNDRAAAFALGRPVGLLRPVITKCLLGIEIRIIHIASVTGIERITDPGLLADGLSPIPSAAERVGLDRASVGHIGQLAAAHIVIGDLIPCSPRRRSGIIVGRRKPFAVFIQHQPDADLLQVAGAHRLTGPVARLLQRRKQHRRQNRDDRYYHEQLNKGEISTHNVGYANVPGMFSLLHLLILQLITHLYLHRKSAMFLSKAQLKCHIYLSGPMPSDVNFGVRRFISAFQSHMLM